MRIWQGICLSAVAFAVPLLALGQNQTLETEYKKLIQVDTDVSPLGANPFGENISLYDGSLSFEQTDVSLKGTGPLVTVSRTFAVSSNNETPLKFEGAFGDWELNVPRIETYTANQLNVTAWQVPATDPLARCTNFEAPPVVNGIGGTDPSEPETWWYGYHLIIPGVGSRVLQQPSSTNTVKPSGKTIVAMTKDNWVVSCGVTTDTDGGEGFVVTSPGGTQYTFSHLVYRPMAASLRPGGSGPQGASINFTFAPQANANDSVARRDGLMMVTKVTDRFGQSVTYSYSGDDLTQISASDGRLVKLAYVTGTHRVQTASVTTSTGASRTWTYSYTNAGPVSSVPTLSSVTLPDSSAWSFSLGNFLYAPIVTPINNCVNPEAATGSPIYGSITHPSGLVGTFGVESITRGRSYVLKSCIGGTASPAEIPQNIFELAIASKSFSGPGLPTYSWTYTYSPANGSWTSDPCATAQTCPTTVWTDLVDPNGNDTRYTFSNRYDETEGHATRTDFYQGSSSGTLIRSETYGYASSTTGPWAAPYVFELQKRTNFHQTEQLTPANSTIVSQDGSAFTRSVNSFDVFGNPTTVTRGSNTGQPSITETTTYLNDLAHWVLGLPQQVVNSGTGEVESSITYESTYQTPTSRARFGQVLMNYTFDFSTGQLSGFTDALGHTTTLSNWKRGIPQNIGYPAGSAGCSGGTASESLVVDDYGQIASITNQAGNTTNYEYDAMGRVRLITFPTGDEQPWNQEIISFGPNANASHDIAANHWERVVNQGSTITTTWYDALFRPILSQRGGSGVTPITSSSSYDFKGNKIFQSYPVAGDPNVDAMTLGVTTEYDAISRPISATQSSELGNLTVGTSYLSGARKQVTDAKGNVTVTAFQVFDEPTFDNVISVAAPAGITQSITRDIYGNFQSITQGGVTKYFYYDGFYRLCRTEEPESKSDVMSYDVANNLAWTASGQDISGSDCGQDQVAEAARTIHGYDSMNRETSVAYPAPTNPTTMCYSPTGKPEVTTSGVASWQFAYNKLDDLRSETLSVDGHVWQLTYTHDLNGALSQTQYPSGKAVAFNPDALGRPTTAGSYATAATYFADGDLQAFNFGNGALYSATKNNRNLLSNFSYGVANGISVSEDLAYDANANITQITDLTNGGLRDKTFGYDGINRLTSASAPNLWGAENYSYDALNNISSLTSNGMVNTYNYDGSHRLASISQGSSSIGTFGYDARGNVVNHNSANLVFDEANRLVQSVGMDAYAYDARGRRVKRTTSGGSTVYYGYSQAGQLMWQYDSSATTETDFIYLGKKLIASAVNATIPTNSPTLSGPATAQVNQPYTLTWTAVPGAATYLLQEQVNGAAFNPVVNANELSQSTGHTGPATFGYQVEACNDAGCGPPSNSVNIVVQPPPSAPEAPATASAVLSSDASTITVSWDPTADTTSYVAQQQLNGGSWQPLYTGMSTTTSLSSATEGTYGFQVHSCNTNGCSAWTSASAVDVTHLAVAPAAISVPPTTNGSLSVGWAVGSYATYYSLEQSVNGGPWVNIINPTTNSWSTTITTSGTYAYRVRSCNAHGCSSAYSPTGTTTATIAPASAPSISVPASSNTGSYTVSWSAVAGGTAYTLQEQSNGGGFTNVQASSATSWPTAGRGNGTYGYRAQACNGGGCGPFSSVGSVTVALVPSVPTGLAISLVNVNKGLVTLNWNAASGATDYKIKYASSSANGTSDAGAALTLTGLYRPVHGQISFYVEACNASGCSPWSAALNTALNSD
ncbi:RHS repeat domain-containing protein [Pinirhizobacter soli]|uniref:RHS repeat domain-containing protein n=1 Tax=Pinirhizobacter soli TaxID=2786953 RepID=UPI00202A4934|nr:RHS repeat domain-containing protein [Pinirhizobacter soli]